MKNFIYLISIPFILLLAGCNSSKSSAENHAEEICDCLQEIGVNKDLNLMKMQDRTFMREMEDKAERILPAKMLKIMKEIEKDLSNLSKNEKKDYTRAFLKAIIDTECADVAFENIPYDMMGMGIGSLERELERSKRRREEYPY